MTFPKNIRTIAASSFIAALAMHAAPALAQDGDDAGFYLSAKAGVEILSDSDFIGVQAPEAGVPGMTGAPAEVNVDFDTGFSINGAVGYDFDDGIISFLHTRIEVEAGYIEADVGGGAFNGGNQVFGGDISNFTLTAGFQTDIVWADDQKVVPYFCGGIGIAVVDANINYFPNNGIATAPTFGVFGSDTAFVSRNQIGVAAKASDRFDIFAEARYTRTNDLDFERRFVAGGADGFSANVSGDVESFGFNLGARVRF
jgi:hypothetical protein